MLPSCSFQISFVFTFRSNSVSRMRSENFLPSKHLIAISGTRPLKVAPRMRETLRQMGWTRGRGKEDSESFMHQAIPQKRKKTHCTQRPGVSGSPAPQATGARAQSEPTFVRCRDLPSPGRTNEGRGPGPHGQGIKFRVWCLVILGSGSSDTAAAAAGVAVVQ
ncbi:hypothetical protein RRG08_065082, partial [Elysia crispata]